MLCGMCCEREHEVAMGERCLDIQDRALMFAIKS